jgi:D-glycero-D-manno-heptose 1,7-bisphosphate phosphatase
MQPALFLDRDGVINFDHGYVYQIEKFEFIDGIFELVCAANKAGYLVVVVTNQAGIGRGYYTENDFTFITDWMCTQFSQYGAEINAVYFSPYHPEHGIGYYRKETECRKPNPGMIIKAAKENKINLNESILIGDKITDLMAGKRAKVETLLYLGEDDINIGIKINNLADAKRFLKKII